MNYTKHSHEQLAGFDCCWLGHGQLGAELTVVKDLVLSMQNLGVKINAPPSQEKNSQCLLISVFSGVGVGWGGGKQTGFLKRHNNVNIWSWNYASLWIMNMQ